MNNIKKEQRLKEAENNTSRKAAEEKEKIKMVQLRDNFQILYSQEIFTSYII